MHAENIIQDESRWDSMMAHPRKAVMSALAHIADHTGWASSWGCFLDLLLAYLEALLAPSRTDYGLRVEVRRGKPAGGEGNEERFAVLPAVVDEKEHRLFGIWWSRLEALSAAGLRASDVDFGMSLAAEVRARWGWRRLTNARIEAGWGRRYMKTEIAAAGRILRDEPHSVDGSAARWWLDHRQVDLEELLRPAFGQIGMKF